MINNILKWTSNAINGQGIESTISEYSPTSGLNNAKIYGIGTAIAVIVGLIYFANRASTDEATPATCLSSPKKAISLASKDPFFTKEFSIDSLDDRNEVLALCNIWEKWTCNNQAWEESTLTERKFDWNSTAEMVRAPLYCYKAHLALAKYSDKNISTLDTNIYINYKNDEPSIPESIALVRERGDALHLEVLITNPKNIIEEKNSTKAAGRALIHHLFQLCMLKNKKSLKVDATNGAVGFYQKMGFKNQGAGDGVQKMSVSF